MSVQGNALGGRTWFQGVAPVPRPKGAATCQSRATPWGDKHRPDGFEKNKRPPDLNPEGAAVAERRRTVMDHEVKAIACDSVVQEAQPPESGWRASHGSHGGTVVTGSDWLEATTLWEVGSTAAGSQ